MVEKLQVEIEYNPDDVGKIVLNSRGKYVTVRKYHMTDKEIEQARRRFQESIKDVPQHIREKADPYFFNPYRPRGVYYAQIQSLYLLGANEWHSYPEVISKMKEFAYKVPLVRRDNGLVKHTNV
jgi:hypothetical protein